jgi:hypothetical protein
MPARKIIAKIIRATGIALGLGALIVFARVMWPVVAMDPSSRNAMRDVTVVILGGFGALASVAWPFALLADYIDSPPPHDAHAIDGEAASEALTSEPRPARSTASKPTKQ